MIDPRDGLVGVHLKLMPTGTERLIWGFGDGYSRLDVFALTVDTRRQAPVSFREAPAAPL